MSHNPAPQTHLYWLAFEWYSCFWRTWRTWRTVWCFHFIPVPFLLLPFWLFVFCVCKLPLVQLFNINAASTTCSDLFLNILHRINSNITDIINNFIHVIFLWLPQILRIYIHTSHFLFSYSRDAISFIDSPLICKVKFTHHTSVILLFFGTVRSFAACFSQGKSVAVIFPLKKLSSQALPAMEAAEAPIDGITALDFTRPLRSAPLCSAVLRCCSRAVSWTGMWTTLKQT